MSEILISKNTYKRINRDLIKFIAVIAMLLNHIAHVFLENGTVIHFVFINIGYFTAITMCYFLTEGYMYTRSKKKYAIRLLVFAVISQLPYMLAFDCIQFNMLFTLLFCLVFLWAKENISNKYCYYLVCLLLGLLCLYSDWSVVALIFVNSFYGKIHDKDALKKAWIYNISFIFLFHFIRFIRQGLILCLAKCAASLIAPAVAAILIMYFYNGKKSEKFGALNKWFFYAFYPGHLIVLLMISCLF